MLPNEMTKMSKLFDDPDKLNLASRTVAKPADLGILSLVNTETWVQDSDPP